VKAARAEKEFGSAFHGQDYMVYAYLQLADDKDAHAVLDEMKALPATDANAFGTHFALAASPARYMIERGDWAGAAQLQVHPSVFPHTMAITHFARALGATRSGNPDAAKTDIAKLAELRDKLTEAKDAYWSEQVDIQRQVASAWVLYAQGKRDEALAAMSAAADAEDKTEKHPVTPGVPKPARELYGEMLLESGKPTEALAAYEATLKKEPNRLGATAGAAKAAEKAGDSAKAQDYYKKVVAIAGDADKSRAEVSDAHAFLTRKS
jgi:tetratricopeptide (TPR) repeat protein